MLRASCLLTVRSQLRASELIRTGLVPLSIIVYSLAVHESVRTKIERLEPSATELNVKATAILAGFVSRMVVQNVEKV